jgi:hypothetical protein
MTQNLKEVEIAAALAISVRHVRRLAARGMPTDTVAAARRWRERNLAGRATSDTDLLAARTRLVFPRPHY